MTFYLVKKKPTVNGAIILDSILSISAVYYYFFLEDDMSLCLTIIVLIHAVARIISQFKIISP